MPEPSILSVCVKNAGRSQMPAALARLRAGGSFEVRSEGTRPGTRLNDESRASIEAVGVTFDAECPKPIDPDLLRRFDRVVILGGEAVVEPIEGMRGTLETWRTDEPTVRGITGSERMELRREDTNRRVVRLLADLDIDPINVPRDARLVSSGPW